MRTTPSVTRVANSARVLLVFVCAIIAAPRLSAEITLVSRHSDARAYARTPIDKDSPAAQTQDDFLSANLGSMAAAKSLKGGAVKAETITSSAIVVDNSTAIMQVTGSAAVHVNVFGLDTDAEGAANLIVLTFALSERSYLYSLTGQLVGNGASSLGTQPAIAKLTSETATIFDVPVVQGLADLSENGTLPPGTYTLTIEVSGFDFSVQTLVQEGVANGNFDFELTPGSTPTPMPFPTGTPTPVPSHATNLSTRMLVQAGDGVAVGGFIITGTESKQIAIAGIGPSLGGTGVSNFLADPVLELHGPPGFTTLVVDDYCHWNPGCCFLPRRVNDLESQCVQPPIPPPNYIELEPLFYLGLDPGAYTVIMRGNGNPVGIGLIEVFDVNQISTARLANLSSRVFVGNGSEIAIAGFLLGGSAGNDTIVIRGLGLSLTAGGITNVLVDPVLQLRDSDGAVVAGDNDWMEYPPQAEALVALGLAPTDPRESAIVMTLAPGAYTALLSGADNGTGVGLVEVYDVGSQ
jgi:hypothetical protein